MQFDPQKGRAAPAKVIPFPAKNRVGHIRRTADRIFNSRTDREADDFRRRAIEGLSRQMEKAGVPADRIAAELCAFHDGIARELNRIEYRSYEPGGNAA